MVFYTWILASFKEDSSEFKTLGNAPERESKKLLNLSDVFLILTSDMYDIFNKMSDERRYIHFGYHACISFSWIICPSIKGAWGKEVLGFGRYLPDSYGSEHLSHLDGGYRINVCVVPGLLYCHFMKVL